MYIMSESPVMSRPEITKKTRDKIRFEACLQTVGDVNRNKRRYSKDILEGGIAKIQERLDEGSFIGELDHPISTNPTRQVTVLYKEASHRIMEMGWDGDKLVGVVESLRSPNGKILRDLAEDGLPIGFSFRGMGDLKPVQENGAQVFEVQGPIHCVTWDSVSYPSHASAKITKITESVMQGIQEAAAHGCTPCQERMNALNEAYGYVHEAQGVVESDGLICTNEGVCYMPNEFDRLVEQRIVRLMDKFRG